MEEVYVEGADVSWSPGDVDKQTGLNLPLRLSVDAQMTRAAQLWWSRHSLHLLTDTHYSTLAAVVVGAGFNQLVTNLPS